MDRPTFEALKRILERSRPRNFDSKQVRDDWMLVVAWMHEAERDLDDLESLGTDGPPTLREVGN